MGNIIIANNPKFSCHYDDDQLPQFDSNEHTVLNIDGTVKYSKSRDIEILLSQLGGTLVRGDTDVFNTIYDSFKNKISLLYLAGGHSVQIADGYVSRFKMFIDDPNGIAGKYIMQWLDQKEKRS